MNVERPNPMERPIGLARRFFADQTMLTSLLEVGGPISPGNLKLKCARAVREFDPGEKIVFNRILLGKIVHSTDELEKKAAATLFKISEVRGIPFEPLIDGLQKAVGDLSSRGLVTVLERSILQDILDSLDPYIDQQAVVRLKRELSSIVPDPTQPHEVEAYKPTTMVPYTPPEPEHDEQNGPHLKVLNGGLEVKTLPKRQGNIRGRIPRAARHLTSVGDEPDTDKRFWIEERKAEVERLRESAISMRPEQIEDLVISLRARGDFRRFEIERATGLTESGYDRMIKKLNSEGRIVKNKKGK